MIALIAVALIALAAIAALTYITLRSRLSPGPTLVGKTLVVHTAAPDQKTLRGILHGQHADRLSLREVVELRPGDLEDIPHGGVVHVPVARVLMIQEIPALQAGA